MKLYWAPQTRAARAVWMLEEAGVDYNLKRVELGGPERKDSACMSPIVTVPVILRLPSTIHSVANSFTG